MTPAARPRGVGRSFGLAIIVIAAELWCTTGVFAAPIHRAHEHAVADPVSYRTWPEYVLGGPSVWSSIVHPPLTRGIEGLIWRRIWANPTESNPYVQFFLFKQSIDPPRFNHYHPRLALTLGRIVAASDLAPSTATLPVTSIPAVVEPQQIDSRTVPEPGSALVAVGMIVGFVIVGRGLRH
jgi:hypothetical protein